jgi:hypothetical protein
MRKFSGFETKAGTRVKVESHSPRLLSVGPLGARFEILDDNGKLVGLDYDGEYLITKGSIIQIGSQKYKINRIKKGTAVANGYELYTHRKITTTGTFIVPFLGHNRDYFRWKKEFTNAFIGTDMYGDYGEYIYLLYRFDGTREFGEFEDGLQASPHYVDCIDPDKYHTLYKFSIPTEWRKDIDLVMQGKYSQVSPAAKERIFEFHSSNRNKPIGQVLYRCPARRQKMEKEMGVEPGTLNKDSELLNMFNRKDEIYKNHYIIKENDATKSKASSFEERRT